jgi:hypothetical protein
MARNSKSVNKIEVLLTLYVHRTDWAHTAENVISLEHKGESTAVMLVASGSTFVHPPVFVSAWKNWTVTGQICMKTDVRDF